MPEGGLTTVQQIIVVIVAGVLIISVILFFTKGGEKLLCGEGGWGDQAVNMFYTAFKASAPPSPC